MVIYSPGSQQTRHHSDHITGRYNRRMPAVYSRVSAGMGLGPGHTPSHTQLMSIPLKDSPRVPAEVFASVAPYRLRPRQ